MSRVLLTYIRSGSPPPFFPSWFFIMPGIPIIARFLAWLAMSFLGQLEVRSQRSQPDTKAFSRYWQSQVYRGHRKSIDSESLCCPFQSAIDG